MRQGSRSSGGIGAHGGDASPPRGVPHRTERTHHAVRQLRSGSRPLLWVEMLHRVRVGRPSPCVAVGRKGVRHRLHPVRLRLRRLVRELLLLRVLLLRVLLLLLRVLLLLLWSSPL